MQLSVLFIDQEDFEGYFDISANIDSKYLEPHIRKAQETTIKDILCEDFYTELLEEYAEETLTDANTLILPYVQKCLIFYAAKRYLVWCQTRSTPHGLVRKSSEESQQIDLETLGGLINEAQDDARFFEGELREFLEDNEDDYPTWSEDDCNCDGEGFSGFGITKA